MFLLQFTNLRSHFLMNEQLPIDPADICMSEKELSPCWHQIAIEVPTRQAKRFYKKLKKSGEDSSIESATRLLTNFCIEHALERFELKPIWGPVQPQYSTAPVYKPNQSFLLTINVDDAPEVDWPAFDTLEIIRPIKAMTEEIIDGEMHEQQLDAGERTPIQNDIKTGDEVTCKVTLSEAGSEKVLFEQTSTTMRVPKHSGVAKIFNIEIDNFAESIIGCSMGDVFTLKTTIPEDYLDPTLSGTEVNISVEIQSASRITPATVEQVVKQYGSPSEAILRRQIKMALESKMTRNQGAILAKQIFDFLSEKVDVPIPEWVYENYQKGILNHINTGMKQHGCSDDAITKRVEDNADKITVLSQKQAKRHALGTLLCREFDIKTTEDELIGEIGEMAAEQGRRPEDLRKEIVASGRIKYVAMAALEKKAVKKVLELATVTEMDAEEWVEQKTKV